MYSKNRTTAITTTGIFLAVCFALYAIGVLLPTFGTYLSYIIPGLMAVLKTKFGYKYLTAFSCALLVMVTLFFGIEQLIFGLFLYIPAGFVVALLYEKSNLRNHLIAIVVFALAGILLITAVTGILGVDYKETLLKTAHLNYSIFSSVLETYGIDETYFINLLLNLMWVIIALAGIVYGYILYLINKVVYKKGLQIMER